MELNKLNIGDWLYGGYQIDFTSIQSKPQHVFGFTAIKSVGEIIDYRVEMTVKKSNWRFDTYSTDIYSNNPKNRNKKIKYSMLLKNCRKFLSIEIKSLQENGYGIYSYGTRWENIVGY